LSGAESHRLVQLSDHAKFKGWLLQIATNEARLKRRSRHEKLFESLEELHPDDKDHQFIPSETLERIREDLAPVFKANWFSRVLPFKRKKIW